MLWSSLCFGLIAVVLKITLAACLGDRDCAAGCTCSTSDSTPRFCLNNEIFREELKKINCGDECDGFESPNCTVECSISCRQCIKNAVNAMSVRCAKSTSNLSDSDLKVGITPGAPCISTSWLTQQGLSQHAIYHGGHAPVICVPGLPCGTRGHLLRMCNAERTSCRLVSYADLCKGRDGCSNSEMPVSQLSHSFDWSVFHSSWPSSDVVIELTSLSRNQAAKQFSMSNFIAHITDFLNRNGYGCVSNTVARILYSIRKVSYPFEASEAS